MKRFYFLLLSFVFPVFLFLCGGEIVVRSIPNYYSYKNKWMEQHAEDVETLILGSSHSLNGVIPKYIGKNSFNLALPGQTIKYDHFLFFKWASRYRHLKTLILPISYFSFFIDHSEWIGETYSKIYLGSPFYSNFSRYNIEMLEFKPLHAKYVEWQTNDTTYINEKGWLPMRLKNKNHYGWNTKSGNVRGVREHTPKTWDYVEANYYRITQIVEYCKEHSVRVVLITTPQYKDYNAVLDGKQLKEMRKLINRLQSTYHIEYYDYLEDTRFEEDDFYDPSHLSDVGAKKFSKILMSNLMSHKQRFDDR